MIATILKYASRLLAYVSGLLLLSMMVHVGADVTGKSVFNSPVPGTTEFVAFYYMVGIVFLPMPAVEYSNSGIVADIFYSMFGSTMKRLTMCFSYAVLTVFYAALAYQSAIDFMKNFLTGEMVEGLIALPVWPARIFLVIGFGLAALVGILRAYQTVFSANWREETAPAGLSGANL